MKMTHVHQAIQMQKLYIQGEHERMVIPLINMKMTRLLQPAKMSPLLPVTSLLRFLIHRCQQDQFNWKIADYGMQIKIKRI